MKKYKVKWVETNLGVTRKALRNYEEKGLMDKNSFQNPLNHYREYSDEDLERIWFFRLLQGVGYSINEIVELKHNPDFDIHSSLSDKIKDLERKRDEIEKSIGFAKTMKFLGSFPFPKEMEGTRFDELINRVRESWNPNSNPRQATMQNITEKLLESPGYELTESDLEQVETVLGEFDQEAVLTLNNYFSYLVQRKELGVSDPLVQGLMNAIYRHCRKHFFPENQFEDLTPQKFARLMVRSFTAGDIGLLREQEYGKDGCKFIAEALAHYGGYSSINDIE